MAEHYTNGKPSEQQHSLRRIVPPKRDTARQADRTPMISARREEKSKPHSTPIATPRHASPKRSSERLPIIAKPRTTATGAKPPARSKIAVQPPTSGKRLDKPTAPKQKHGTPIVASKPHSEKKARQSGERHATPIARRQDRTPTLGSGGDLSDKLAGYLGQGESIRFEEKGVSDFTTIESFAH